MQPADPTINKNKPETNCLKCGTDLSNALGWKYCGERCRTLYLKAEYKKRNREKIHAYNQAYNAKGISTLDNPKLRAKHFTVYPVCERCGSDEGLQIAHAKPRWANGQHDRLFTFCISCHNTYDNLTRDFWQTKS